MEYTQNGKVIREPLPGEIYKHFKGKLYQIISIATHSETGEKLVIYQRLYDDYTVYARPYDMFISEVDHVKYPEVEQKYRFEHVIPGKTEVQNNEIQIKKEAEKTDDALKSDNKEYSTSDFENEEIEGCNPDLLAFLEADTCEEKRDVLLRIRKRMDDRLINDIAASLDVTVDDGDIDKRFKSLLSCVDTMMRYECTRLR